jgi:hypothetical protein
MRPALALLAAALWLGTVSVASAQMETGTVIRVDPQSKIVLLDDGRMYRITPNTVLVVGNQPTPITALAPGQQVMIQAGEMVVFRDGQYLAVAPAPLGVAQAPAAPVPATAVPVGVRQTVFGTITDVDRNGQVKIRTANDSFEIKVGPEALRQIKKGDNVTLDVTITPPGAPAASPPTR